MQLIARELQVRSKQVKSPRKNKNEKTKPSDF